MAKKYKIVVSDVVVVPIKGSYSDENGKPVPFKFSLVCKRIGADELKDALTSGETRMQEFLSDIATGWRDQRLVQEEDGTPAEFSADALAALLDISGMAQLVFHAYLKESAAKEKN